jgi:hypothetical protein
VAGIVSRQSMVAFKHYYRGLGNQLWDICGLATRSIQRRLDFADLQADAPSGDELPGNGSSISWQSGVEEMLKLNAVTAK